MSRRFRRWPPVSLFALAALCIGLLGRMVQTRSQSPAHENRVSSGATPAGLREASLVSGPCEVLSIARGDRIEVQQEVSAVAAENEVLILRESVGLIGISVDENPPWDKVAENFTRELLASSNVRLEFDKRRIDRQGRFIAYVYADDKLLNLELVRAGLAQVEPYPGDNMTIARELYRAQDFSKRNERGIWSQALARQ